MSAGHPYFNRFITTAPLQGDLVGYGPDPISTGYQLGAEDPEEAAEVGAAYLSEVGRGVHPGRAIRNVFARMRARRQQRQMARCPPCAQQARWNPGFGGGGADMDMGWNAVGWNVGAEDDGDAEEEVLGALEDDEIAALEADDEDIGGDDDEYTIGASVSSLEHKIQRMTDKLQELQGKLASVPQYRWKRRKKLTNRIRRLTNARERKVAKLNAKRRKLAQKLGVPAAMLMAAGAGAGATMYAAQQAGIPPADVSDMSRTIERARVAQYANQRGIYATTPPEGEEVTLTMLFDGLPYLLMQFPALTAAEDDIAIDGQTETIPYAKLQVVGLRVSLDETNQYDVNNILQPQLTSAILTTLEVRGKINAFYSDQVIDTSGAQWNKSGARGGVGIISGLRENSILETNNRARLQGVYRTHLAVAANQRIDAVFRAAIVCRRLSDPSAERMP